MTARWVPAGLAGLLALLAGCAQADATEGGWRLTVYYTAVESFHTDEPVAVHGCRMLQCSNGDDLLGRYPEDFVEAVRDEGTGRITSGSAAGRYLNWASSEGYWLDDAPRDTAGRPLEPFRSAAADTLPPGTRFDIVDCGHLDGDGPEAVCARLSSGDWEIRDAFTPGLGGDRHVDLYLGEEDRPSFTASQMYATFEGALLRIERPA